MNRVLYFFLLFLLVSCNRYEKVYTMFDRAESLIREYPDSAFALLDSASAESQNYPRDLKMRYELLKADAQNKAYIDFTTDSVMLIVADYYDHHGTSNDQLRAHYLLGCTYRDLKDVPMELQCFQDAAEKADTTQQDCDLYTLAAVYGQMADLYHYQYLPQEELKALTMCERIAVLNHDTLNAIKAYELRLRAYFLLDNKDSILSITYKARNKYLYYKNKKYAAQLLVPAIYLLLYRGENDSAKHYMDIYESESGMYSNGKIISDDAKVYYFCKGKYYINCNNLDSARCYFLELLKENHKEAAYKGFVSLYMQTSNPDSLAKYARLYVTANDSDRMSINSAIIAQMTAMYNYSRHENMNRELRLKISQEKLTNKTMLLYVTFVTFFVIILVLVIMYAYKEHYRKNKQKLAETVVRFNSLKQSLKESESKKEKLEKQLSLLEGASDDIVRKHEQELSILNERIELANRLIDNYRKRHKDVDFNVWLDKFLSAEVVFVIKDILKPHKLGHRYTADDNLWLQIYEHFNQEASQFVALLENEEYGLNEIDTKVIMLTVMDFGTSEVALLLDKSNNHITNIRKRITNKMFNDSVSARKLREELLALMKEFVTHSN